ncbi:MAG: HNH endonuclease [Nanobdellota archaeon]
MGKEQWRVDVGNTEKRNRIFYTHAIAPFLKRWIKERGNKRICPICGEDMPETFHKHHIDGNHENKLKDNLVEICGSCHAITYRTKTRLKELWIKRHNKLFGQKKSSEKSLDKQKMDTYPLFWTPRMTK